MDKLLPKWIMERYIVLWRNFSDKPFAREDVARLLKNLKKPDDGSVINLLLSELRKAGWLKVEFDQSDTRKRVYTLKIIDFNKSFKEAANSLVNEGTNGN